MAARTASSGSAASFTGTERVIVLHGDDAFLQTEALVQLRAAMLKHHGDEAETIRFEGKTATLADVLDEVRSFGLMQRHRLVIVDDADPFITRHREVLERYAADPAPTATLLLRAGTWNSSWKLHKAAESVGAVVKCSAPTPEVAQTWAIRRAKSHHRAELKPAAAAALIEHLGSDLARLDSELGKLAVSVGEGQPIDVAVVEKLVGHTSEEKAWEIQSALLSGRARVAIEKLHELVDLSGQPEVLVTYFVADLVRKLHQAAVMGDQGVSTFDICKTLKVWPRERQGPFLQAARRLGRSGSARLLASIVEIDQRSKSGFGKNLGGLERFTVQFTRALA